MLDRDTILIIIDFQERMIPHIVNNEEILKKAKKLVKAAKIFELPILRTEQRKLGETVDGLREGELIEKITFSCYREKKFVEKLEKLNKKKCLLIGIEAHICVLQTALDLLANKYEVYVSIDCIGSRNEIDKEIAIQRMISQGVRPTTAEAAIYEILESAEAKEFKEILKLVKEK
ncbi:MAG: hydrolase [Thermoplasmata archaeon]|nr:MAG: hydrolase [Thermoplasmata archaeon]